MIKRTGVFVSQEDRDLAKASHLEHRIKESNDRIAEAERLLKLCTEPHEDLKR